MSSQVDADTNDLVHSIYDSVKNFFTLSRLTPVEIENLFSEESINEINGFLDQLNMALSELQDSISINEIQSITPALTEYIESTEYIEKNIDKQYLSTLSNQENEQFAIIEKAILVSDCFKESGISDLNVISNDKLQRLSWKDFHLLMLCINQ